MRTARTLSLVKSGSNSESSSEVSTSLQSLFSLYEKERKNIEYIGSIVGANESTAEYFFTGNKAVRAYASEVFKVEGALKALDASFWSKAIALTDVMSFMAAEDRSNWNNDIHEMKTVPFTPENVIPTLQGLLLSRDGLLAKRVDGIFRALSGSHVTNTPQGFSKRMIIEHVFDSIGCTNYRKTEFIHDLRVVIAKFANRDMATDYSTSSMLSSIFRDEEFGMWIELDGGALKFRVYKVGTVHIEVHPEVAVDLNNILSSLYPGAIAAKSRTKSSKSKEIPLRMDFLPKSVLDKLCSISENVGRGRVAFVSPKDMESTEYFTLVEILEYFGGIKDGNTWSFGDGVHSGLNTVIRMGCIPEKKSHQFYPTKEALARLVVDMAGISREHSVLEPSAGQGGIADYIPSKDLTCVEISEANAAVLKGKGKNVIIADFLTISNKRKFDRIVMNPPFDQGQAERHVKHAATLLEDDGRLVAILPASMKGKHLVSGLEHSWGEVISGAFDGANVNVVTLILEKSF